MILDALLKTKSRAVLNDIINKNGKCVSKYTVAFPVYCSLLILFSLRFENATQNNEAVQRRLQKDTNSSEASQGN